MIGFEVDRAQSIVENYEPAEIVIGMSGLTESINKELYERNRGFFEGLSRQFVGRSSTFEFSGRDPLKTAQDLERAIRLDEDTNVILAPLHTKLSTVGAGLYALRHPSVQICYAQVDEYNEATYSSPGDDAYVFAVGDLLASIS